MPLQRLEIYVVLSVAYLLVISQTRDHHLCNFTEWKLVEQEHHNTKTVSGVLNKGDGGKQEVLTEVVIQGGKSWYNVSYIVEDCCVGYERRGWRDKCKALTTSTTAVTTVSVLSIKTTPKPHVDTFAGWYYENCDICHTYNNCTSRRCLRAQGRTDDDDAAAAAAAVDNSTMILVTVISSLGTIIIVLLVMFLLRERYHRRRNNTVIQDYEIPGRQLYDGLMIANNQEVTTNINGAASVPEVERGDATENQYENATTEIPDENEYHNVV